MRIFFVLSGLIAISALSFWAGAAWKGKTIGSALKFELTEPVELQLSPDRRGILPKGAVLYQYKELPEITIYYAFINLKERNLLRPYDKEDKDKYNIVVPLDAFPIENRMSK